MTTTIESESPVTQDVYVSRNGHVAKFELSDEVDSNGNQLAQGPVFENAQGKKVREMVPLLEGALDPEVQRNLGERFARAQLAAGHEAVEDSGIVEPDPTEVSNPYDNLLNPDYEGGSAEEARVDIPEDTGARLTRERRHADAEHARDQAYSRGEDWKVIEDK